MESRVCSTSLAAYSRNAVQIVSADRAVKEKAVSLAVTVPLPTVAAVATARVGFSVLALEMTSVEVEEAVVMIGVGLATIAALAIHAIAAWIARMMR